MGVAVEMNAVDGARLDEGPSVDERLIRFVWRHRESAPGRRSDLAAPPRNISASQSTSCIGGGRHDDDGGLRSRRPCLARLDRIDQILQ